MLHNENVFHEAGGFLFFTAYLHFVEDYSNPHVFLLSAGLLE
jgi:hypothetical protein